MNKYKLIALASVAALTFSSASFAEEKAKGEKMGDEDHMMHRMMDGHMMHQMMDTNKDGIVSKEEFTAYRTKEFMDADKNKDKGLNFEEFTAHGHAMEEARRKAMEAAKQERMKEHFGKLDADHDGKISKAEFDAQGESNFKRMDHNNDGMLSKDDRKKDKRKNKHKEKYKSQPES